VKREAYLVLALVLFNLPQAFIKKGFIKKTVFQTKQLNQTKQLIKIQGED
jgi:hypothetical protein